MTMQNSKLATALPANPMEVDRSRLPCSWLLGLCCHTDSNKNHKMTAGSPQSLHSGLWGPSCLLGAGDFACMAATAILQALSGPLTGRLLASLPALPQPLHHRHARHCSWCDCCRQALSLPAPALLKGAVGHTTLILADVSHVATTACREI